MSIIKVWVEISILYFVIRGKENMKCKHCKQDFGEEQMIKVNKKIYYCKDCYENWFVPEVEDYNELYETFKKVKLITDDKPNVKVISYYKKLHNEHGLTYYGMKLTIEFMYYIMDRSNMGLLPKYDNFKKFYNLTKKYYDSLYNIKEVLEEVNGGDFSFDYLGVGKHKLKIEFNKDKT